MRWAAGAVVATVFMAAAIAKSFDPRATTAAMDYAIGIGRWSGWLVLLGVVLAEWSLGVFLLFGLARRPAALAGCALLIIFSGYLVLVIAKGSPAGCGCGLWWTRQLPTQVQAVAGLARNLFLLGFLVVSLGRPRSGVGIDLATELKT